MISQNQNEEEKSELSADQKLIEQLQNELLALKDSKTQELLALNEKYEKLAQSFDEIQQANHDWESKVENQRAEYRDLENRLKAYEMLKNKGPEAKDYLLKEMLAKANLGDALKPGKLKP